MFNFPLTEKTPGNVLKICRDRAQKGGEERTKRTLSKLDGSLAAQYQTGVRWDIHSPTRDALFVSDGRRTDALLDSPPVTAAYSTPTAIP